MGIRKPDGCPPFAKWTESQDVVTRFIFGSLEPTKLSRCYAAACFLTLATD